MAASDLPPVLHSRFRPLIQPGKLGHCARGSLELLGLPERPDAPSAQRREVVGRNLSCPCLINATCAARPKRKSCVKVLNFTPKRRRESSISIYRSMDTHLTAAVRTADELSCAAIGIGYPRSSAV